MLDFGAGSGVAGIAAAKAGALEVLACDLDPLAIAACRANAELNDVQLNYSTDFFAEADRFDLILVADVLYDRANLPLLDQFLSRGREALVADSRVQGFSPSVVPAHRDAGSDDPAGSGRAPRVSACEPVPRAALAKSFASKLAPTLDPCRPLIPCGSELAREGALSGNASLTATPLPAAPHQAV